MCSPTILVISDPLDDQARTIYEEIATRNANTHLILFNAGTEFCARVDSASGFELEVGGRTFSHIDALYVRLKYGDATMDVGRKLGVASLQETEWNGFARAIQSMFRDVNIIPFAPDPAGYKLRQLAIAQEVGFAVPETVIFLGKKHAAEFTQRHRTAVLKNLNSPRFLLDNLKPSALIAARVDATDIDQAGAEEFEVCPVFLQEEVRNSRELRTISFIDKTFCYEQAISVQHENLVDKRILLPSYRLVETPTALKSRITKFLSRSNIRYGVFDILECEGEYVFLECNLDGQWHSANDINAEEVLDCFVRMVLDVSATQASLGKIQAA